MTSYTVKYKSPAKKFIIKNKSIGIRFYKAFEEISKDYISNAVKYDIKKMKGYNESIFRLRIGKYRAVFQVKDSELIILVFDIDSRGEIYK